MQGVPPRSLNENRRSSAGCRTLLNLSEDFCSAQTWSPYPCLYFPCRMLSKVCRGRPLHSKPSNGPPCLVQAKDTHSTGTQSCVSKDCRKPWPRPQRPS